MGQDFGLLYIATADEFLEDAREAAQSAKGVMDVPIGLVAHREVSDPVFDEVIIDDDPHDDFADKPRNLLKSPFDQTIYLDTDTYIIGDVSELFDLLDNFNIAAAVDPYEWELRYDREREFNGIPDSLPIYQTGVLAFDDSANTRAFLQKWYQIHQEQGFRRDQASFRRAIWEEKKLQLTALSPIYNCPVSWPIQVIGEVKVLHDGSPGDINNPEHAEVVGKRINHSNRVRVLIDRGFEIHTPLHGMIDRGLDIFYRTGRKILKRD
ncbi:glycosyltransferase family protein [Salarchaeum japonicum]|uniref:Nucleotide-diphospho-sugar transferase domain-containing protein n=1 Tax=Salarchaeum japonicum TaxID=555573 RepID=A0AAV3T2T5_9EURY|nr:hypothetical protein [Salarchaeum japonicum]